jgi:bilin biosynthesis protein
MTQETLFDQLKHPNPNLRERAMWEIVDTRDETTIPRLMAALDDEDVSTGVQRLKHSEPWGWIQFLHW